MKMPSEEVVSKVIIKAMDHGMPEPGSLPPPADTEGLPANVISFIVAAAKKGISIGKTRLAERDEREHRLPQTTPINLLDMTTVFSVPQWVDCWKLEQRNSWVVDLCLVGATRPAGKDEDGDYVTEFVVIPVFQICDHGDSCPARFKGDTRNIGKMDPTRKKGHVGMIEYLMLVSEREGYGICTLLSIKNVNHDAANNHVTVTLEINPNKIEETYPL